MILPMCKISFQEQNFGPRQARLLSKLLTHTQLPGLSSLDQMHLLAMADTVASCKIDLADRFAIDAARFLCVFRNIYSNKN